MYRFLLAAVVVLFSAKVGLADDYYCLTRSIKKPSLAEYSSRIKGQLALSAPLISKEIDTPWVQSALEELLRKFEPKDIFCVLDSNAALPASMLNTGGGNLILLSPSGVADGLALNSPDQVGGATIAETLGRAIMKHRFPVSLLQGCERFIPNKLEPICQGQCAKCVAESRAAKESQTEAFDLEAQSAPLSPSGKIVTFAYPDAQSGTGDSDAVAQFFSEVLARELVMEPLYDSRLPAVNSLSTKDVPGSASLSSTSQWAAMITENLVGVAAISSIIQQLETYSAGSKIVVEPFIGAVPISVLPMLFPQGRMDAMTIAFGEFLCRSNYAEILGLSGAERFWFNLVSYEKAVCGVSSDDDKIAMYSPSSIEKRPDDIGRTLSFFKDEDATSRLEKRLIELQGIELDQSSLLNELRSYIGATTFEGQIERLKEALAEVEKKGKGPTVLGQVGTLGQLGTGVGGFISAVGGLVGVWSGIPAANAASQTEYMWQKRGDLGEVGGQFGKSVSEIEGSLSEIRRWFERNKYIAQADDLKAAIGELEAAYRALLSDVVAARKAYRSKIDLISAEIEKIDFARENLKHGVWIEAPDIAMLNLLAFSGSDQSSKTMLGQCYRAISIYRDSNSFSSLPTLIGGCLEISSEVKKKQNCLANAESQPDVGTTIRAGQLRTLMTYGDASACF